MMNVRLAINPNGERIFVVNTSNTGSYFDGTDIIYIPAGSCAQTVVFDEASDFDLNHAFGPDDSIKLMGDHGEDVYETWKATDWRLNMNRVFYSKVNEFALVTPAEELYDLIQFCKANHNQLPEKHQDECYRINNADDCYYSALIALTRPQFGQNVERKIFNALAEDKYEFCKQVEDCRKALDIISEELDESLEDLITIHK